MTDIDPFLFCEGKIPLPPQQVMRDEPAVLDLKEDEESLAKEQYIADKLHKAFGEPTTSEEMLARTENIGNVCLTLSTRVAETYLEDRSVVLADRRNDDRQFAPRTLQASHPYRVVNELFRLAEVEARVFTTEHAQSK